MYHLGKARVKEFLGSKGRAFAPRRHSFASSRTTEPNTRRWTIPAAVNSSRCSHSFEMTWRLSMTLSCPISRSFSTRALMHVAVGQLGRCHQWTVTGDCVELQGLKPNSLSAVCDPTKSRALIQNRSDAHRCDFVSTSESVVTVHQVWPAFSRRPWLPNTRRDEGINNCSQFSGTGIR